MQTCIFKDPKSLINTFLKLKRKFLLQIMILMKMKNLKKNLWKILCTIYDF